METSPVYLNGSFVVTGDRVEVRNPATGEVVGCVSSVGTEVVHQAVNDAGDAFPAWRRLTAMARADCLLAVARALAGVADEMARVITLENGKPLAQSQGEVRMAIDHFRWSAEEARRAYGRIVPHQADGKRHMVIRMPVGVAAAIAP